MPNQLKLYHKIFALISIPLCVFIIIYFGWIGYATLRERPGLYGDLYYYYQMTRPQFYIYNFVVALLALGFIFLHVVFLLNKDSKQLARTIWMFALFIGLIIIAEIYLETRFTGKG